MIKLCKDQGNCISRKSVSRKKQKKKKSIHPSLLSESKNVIHKHKQRARVDIIRRIVLAQNGALCPRE